MSITQLIRGAPRWCRSSAPPSELIHLTMLLLRVYRRSIHSLVRQPRHNVSHIGIRRPRNPRSIGQASPRYRNHYRREATAPSLLALSSRNPLQPHFNRLYLVLPSATAQLSLFVVVTAMNLLPAPRLDPPRYAAPIPGPTRVDTLMLTRLRTSRYPANIPVIQPVPDPRTRYQAVQGN